MLTFETKCYEKDWRFVLQGNYLKKLIERCNYNFTEKHLIINNVKNKEQVRQVAEKQKQRGIIDNYYFADEYAEKALIFFNINRDSFGKGYYYSISELVGLFVCKTDFLLHFSSDAFLDEYANSQWIIHALKLMQKNRAYIVSNPTWNNHFSEAKNESISEIDKFYVSYGFSDQCYLVNAHVFRGQIYNEKHSDSERYPTYGGELFEKRVDSFMRNNQLVRLTYKEESYIHANFPTSVIKRFLLRLLAIFNNNFSIKFRETER